MLKPKTFIVYGLFSLITACSMLTGCHKRNKKSDFYSTTKTVDLWRFPLISPYELVSPTNSGDWFLNLTIDSTALHPDFFYQQADYQLSDINTVGIKDSSIVIHCNNLYWPKLSGQYNSTVFIHCPSHQVFIFSDKHHAAAIKQMMTTYKLHNLKLHRISDLIGDFQSAQKFPAEWPNSSTLK